MFNAVKKIVDPNLPASPALSVALCSDDREVLTAGLDFQLRKWDLNEGMCTHSWNAGGPLWSIGYVSTNDTAFLGAVQGIPKWDVQAWKLREENQLWSYRAIHDIAYSEKMEEILGACEDAAVHRWKMHSGEKLESLTGHSTSISAVGISSNGYFAVSGDISGEVRLWDLETSRCLETWAAHENKVCSIDILADDGCAITCSTDGTLRLWNLESIQPEMSVKVDGGGLCAAVVYRDGTRAVAAGDRGFVLWNLESGKLETSESEVHVADLALSSDERFVIGIVRSNELCFWPIDG
jgi:WD40 repeat protein